MKIGYNTHSESYYRYDAYAIGPDGFIYFLLVSAGNIIYKFDTQLNVVKEIDISDLSRRYRKRTAEYYFSTGLFRNIFVTQDNHLVLVSGNDNYHVIDQDGKVINRFPDKNLIDSNSNDQGFACHFYPLTSGHIITQTSRGFYGNLIAISKEPNPSFLSNTPFATKFLNVTSWFDHKTEVHQLIANLETDDYENRITIGKRLKQICDDYTYKKPVAEKIAEGHVHHVTSGEIYQVIELDEERILTTVYTDRKSKSHYPDKNMPYYFFILNKNTGEILKEVKPKDRSVYQNNMNGKIIKWEDNTLLFKTHDNIFIMDYDLIIVQQISLLERAFSKLRKLALLGKSGNTLLFGNRYPGDIVTFPFENELLEDLKSMMKELKVAMKKK